MNKNKIAFIMDTPFTLGGEQRVTTVISNILSSINYDVSIICTNSKVKENRNLYKMSKNIKIETLSNQSLFCKVYRKMLRIIMKFLQKTKLLKHCGNLWRILYFDPLTKKELIKKINEKKYQVSIGIGGDYNILLAQIKDKVSSKVVGWQHATYESYFEMEGRRYALNRNGVSKLLSTLDEYIVLTDRDKKLIEEHLGIPTTRIYNPLSFESDKTSNLNEKNFIILGRFVHAKGIDLALTAFKEYRKLGGNWNLTIVGDGPEKENILSLISEYGLSQFVVVNGFTDNVQQYLLNSSVLLLPSRWEGFGLVVTEAFEMGVPVITFDIPAMAEIISETKSGLLVKNFDTTEMAKAMLAFSSDFKYLQEYAKNAKKRAKSFSHSEIGKQWQNLIEGVVNNENKN